MRRLKRRLLASERGATAVEYGFILALVVIAVIGALTSFAEASNDIWSNISRKVVSAG
jgi:pilus assembly protein Flp/PilA